VRARLLTSAPLLAAGTLSYGLYLWHFPVIFGLRAAGLWPAALAGAMALTLAVSAALAAASWFALERPVLRWAHRRARRRSAASAPSARPLRPAAPLAAARPG
jgi:peptidoglycan/LPS O-acetylase OafA/YrhL